MKTIDEEQVAQRDAVLRRLGIAPEAIVWPDAGTTETPDLVDESVEPDQVEDSALTDAEWQAIAPFLPMDAPQASMTNRAFVNAVLSVVRRRRRWTALEFSEPIRKRFARWAHRNIWQNLAAAVDGLDLARGRKAEFASVARRAERLQCVRGR